MRFEPMLPWWMLLLLFTPFVVWFVLAIVRKYRKKSNHSTIWLVRVFGIILCLFAISVGPSIPGERSPAGVVNLDVVIVVDRTPSISAEDYDGQKPRLEGVKQDVLALINRLRGARIALITFGTEPTLNVPFTSDSSAASTAVKILDQEIYLYSKGSSIDGPLDTTVKLLKQSKEKYPDRGRLLFYIGDGEQTADTIPKSFSLIKPLVSGGAVLGYGTTTGGKMKVYYGYQDYKSDKGERFIEDYSGYTSEGYKSAVSKIDEENLRTIASDIGIAYLHRTSPNQLFNEIVDSSNMQIVADTHREVLHYISLYWVFAIGIWLLLMWWYVEVSSVIRDGLRKVSDL